MHIIIITNAILVAKRIFDTFLHLYQLYSIVISNDLKKFFNKNLSNTISFWNCSSDNKWPLYLLVDKKLKLHNISSILSSKTSWDFSRKKECDSIVKKWQMHFQVSNYKRRNFLNLNDNDNNFICPTYLKDRAWLKCFSLSNSLYTHITRLITNYTPISKYKQRFFPIHQSHAHVVILLLKQDHIFYMTANDTRSHGTQSKNLSKNVLTFLEFNPGTFCFQESIILI